MSTIILASALDSHMEPDAAERAESDANHWIKQLRHARIDGQTFRDRFTCRGDSLWWFAELYLHKRRIVVNALRAGRALEALAASGHTAAWDLTGASPLVAQVARQVAARRGVTLNGAPRALSPVQQRGKALFHTAAALADRLRPQASPPAASGVTAAFVHSAFARGEAADESYVGPVLRELTDRIGVDRLRLVGLGPRTNFRVRRWRDRLREFADPGASNLALTPVEAFAGWRDLAASRAQWGQRHDVQRALVASKDLRDLSNLEAVDLWPVLLPELEGIAALQFPWSVRAMDEASAALDRLEPSAVLTYAEAGGWGRALILEARRRRVPSVALQHGFIYRHWLNYLHEPDEAQPSHGNPSDCGFPFPTRTLLFDEYAREHLECHGSFAASALAVTGSPRLDRLVASAATLSPEHRQAMRHALRIPETAALVTLAAKHTQMAAAFRELVATVRSRSDVVLVIKPHPAEGAAPYLRDAEGASNVRVAPATADLGVLTAMSSVLVTVNSTAAIEAMALDVPALVVDLPSNLSPFVDAGVMVGARAGEIGLALEGLLYDHEMRARLAAARRAFVSRYRIHADGSAAARAADLIVGLSRH